MEGGRIKALFVDISKRAHHTTVTCAEQVKIFRMLAVFSEHRNRVDARSIMMKLALDAGIFCSVYEIPVTARTPVVSPMRKRRHVSDDCIYRDFCLVVISEVFAPGVDLFLPGRVPRHLASERISFCLPMVGSRFHRSFKFGGLFVFSLALEVGEDRDKNIALHLSELRQVGRKARHSQRCLVSLLQIPIP